MWTDYLRALTLALPFASAGSALATGPLRPPATPALPASRAQPTPPGLGGTATVPVVPLRPAIDPHATVLRFCDWMRDWGFTGWHLPEDILGFYQWFCADEGLAEIPYHRLLTRLAAAPGVRRETRSLADADLPDHPVIAALIGNPAASNDELARRMGVNKGEATKRRREVEHLLSVGWDGRHKPIALKADRQLVRIRRRLGGADAADLFRVADREELAAERQSGSSPQGPAVAGAEACATRRAA